MVLRKGDPQKVEDRDGGDDKLLRNRTQGNKKYTIVNDYDDDDILEI